MWQLAKLQYPPVSISRYPPKMMFAIPKMFLTPTAEDPIDRYMKPLKCTLAGGNSLPVQLSAKPY